VDRRQRHRTHQTGAVEPRPPCGPRVAARLRPVIVFDHTPPRICPSRSRDLDGRRLEDVPPSASAQAGRR
jgi:hypothetical protein